MFAIILGCSLVTKYKQTKSSEKVSSIEFKKYILRYLKKLKKHRKAES